MNFPVKAMIQKNEFQRCGPCLCFSGERKKGIIMTSVWIKKLSQDMFAYPPHEVNGKMKYKGIFACEK